MNKVTHVAESAFVFWLNILTSRTWQSWLSNMVWLTIRNWIWIRYLFSPWRSSHSLITVFLCLTALLVLWRPGTPECCSLLQPRESSRNALAVFGKLYPLPAAINVLIALVHYIEKNVGRPLTLHMFTDPKCLFEFITKNSTTKERRLMIGVLAVLQLHELIALDQVVWIRLDHNKMLSSTSNKDNYLGPHLYWKTLLICETTRCYWWRISTAIT